MIAFRSTEDLMPYTAEKINRFLLGKFQTISIDRVRQKGLLPKLCLFLGIRLTKE